MTKVLFCKALTKGSVRLTVHGVEAKLFAKVFNYILKRANVKQQFDKLCVADKKGTNTIWLYHFLSCKVDEELYLDNPSQLLTQLYI